MKEETRAKEFPLRLTAIIDSYLNDRTIIAQAEVGYIPIPTYAGVPQGSVIGLTL